AAGGRPIVDDPPQTIIAGDIPGRRRSALAAALDDIAQSVAQIADECLLQLVVESRCERKKARILRLEICDGSVHEVIVIYGPWVQLHGNTPSASHTS